MNQKQLSTINEKSWNTAAYEAWTNRHGAPADYAKKIMEDPIREVDHYLPYIQSPKGKRIINLLGSKGNKAVALALLGADVTVVDISASNAKYANELADAAGVSIEYVVSDVLHVQLSESFDIVLLEMMGGRLLIISCKQDDSHEGSAFHLTEAQKESLPKTTIRRWTLGEIVTTLAEEHFKIEKLVEEHGPHQRWVFPSTAPEGIEERVPGLYTLIATACKKGSLHG